MSTTESGIERNFDGFLENTPGLRGSSILIGFSGGPDSVCLAFLFHKNASRYLLKPVLAYLDHGLRPDRERREEHFLVEKTAGELGFPLCREFLSPGLIRGEAARQGRSTEETARDIRYDFLLRMQKEKGCSFLALGHHNDDQMETLIMRFFQGSGVQGLSGFSGRREGGIIRPLIGCEKQEILEYLESRRLSYVTDSTNRENDFLRNRVRNRLVPVIKEIFPGYRSSLNRFQSSMESLGGYIDRESREKLVWSRQGAYMVISAEIFFSQPPVLQEESLFSLYNSTCPEVRRVPFRFIRSLKRPSGDSFRQILLKGAGVLLEQKGDMLFWSRDIVFPGENSYLITVNKAMEFSISGVNFKIRETSRNQIPCTGVTVSRDQTEPPLILRPRAPGDFINLAGGGKTLKKLYNSWHIPEEDRWKIPVIEDRSGIIGIIGTPWGGKNLFCSSKAAENPAESGSGWLITWSEGSV